MTTANGIPIYHGDYRFGQLPNLFVQIENIQPRYAIVSNISTDSFNVLIPSATKSFIASTCKKNNVDIITLPANFDSLKHLYIGLGSKCIVNLWAIDCDFSNSVVNFKQDIGVGFYGFPNWFHIQFFTKLRLNLNVHSKT